MTSHTTKASGWRSRTKRTPGGRKWFFDPVGGLWRADAVLESTEFPRHRYVPCAQRGIRTSLDGTRPRPRLVLARRDGIEPLVVDGELTTKGRAVEAQSVPWTEFAKELERQRLVVGIDKFGNARIFFDPTIPKPNRPDAGSGFAAVLDPVDEDEE